MSTQHDYVLADQAGAAFLADLNAMAAAIAKQNEGATEPATTYAHMPWADTTSGWMKQRNAANSAWIKRWPLGTGASVDIASATTLDLTSTSASSGIIRVTGITASTGITLEDGQTRLLRAAAAWPITHGASLICPGSASYTCAAGDLILAIGEAAGVVRLMIWKADGMAVVYSAAAGRTKNACYNGACRVLAEAAKSLTTSPLYAKVDAWTAWASGGAVSAGTITQGTSIGTYGKAMMLSGITLTGAGVLSVRQRIPAADAVFLKNKTINFSAHVLQNTGGAINYTIVVRKPTASDNYAGVTTIGTSSAQSVSTGTDTQITYSVAAGDCSAGLEIEIQASCGAITTKNFEYSDMQLEEGSSATEFSQTSLAEDLVKCGFLFEKSYAQNTDPAAATTTNMVYIGTPSGTTNVGTGIRWKFPKRAGASHTFTHWDGAGNVSKISTYNASGFTHNTAGLASVIAADETGGVFSLPKTDTSSFIHYTDDVRL